MIASPSIRVAYLGATLPVLSETFVSNELLAVRSLGCEVTAASVFPPKGDLSDAALRQLALDAVVVYNRRTWLRAGMEMLTHPLRSLSTLTMALGDSLGSGAGSMHIRLRCAPQAFASLGLARSLRGYRIAHIHAHMANTPTTIAMYAAAQLGVPFSFTGHANDLFVHRSLLGQKLRRCKFVACISRWHQDLYREILPVSDEKLPVVRCGVNTSRAVAAMHPRTGPIRVVSVGRLVPKKGFDVLIDALAQLPAAPAWTCRIIGDGPERNNLRSLIDSHGLEQRITLTGPASNDQVLAALDEADMFALPCRVDPQTGDKDGIPVVLMEAMAAGRPVISGDLPAIRELVMPMETGMLVEPGSAGSLAAALSLMMSDNALRCRLAEQGRQHVVSEFDRTDNASRLTRLFAS